MTKQEFSELAQYLKAAYPSSKILADSTSLEFWYRMISDIDFKVARQAVLEHIATNVWAPSIAEVRQACTKLVSEPIKDAMEAWGDVVKAIGMYGSDRPQEAYAMMSELTRDIVKQMGWYRLCNSENLTADRANFRETYQARSGELQRQRVLPQTLQSSRLLISHRDFISPSTSEEG